MTPGIWNSMPECVLKCVITACIDAYFVCTNVEFWYTFRVLWLLMAGGVTIPRKNLGASLGFLFAPQFVLDDFRNGRYVGIGFPSELQFCRYVPLRREHMHRFSSVLHEIDERKKI